MFGITVHIIFCFKKKRVLHWNIKDCGSNGYDVIAKLAVMLI
jgi:hypothetical protein